MGTRLIIVDLSNFIFRAFWAIRPLTSPDGVPVNAVYGVLSMLLKLLSQHRPTHMLIAKDMGRDTFRRDLYAQYKAHRDEPPEDLRSQFSIIDDLVKMMGLPICAQKKYEADDVIGSVAVQWQKNFDEIYIASSDKDLMQFVGDNVKILDTMKDKLLGADDVFEKLGVRPDQVVDYLSIVGDSSDNIPGMKGIGAKGASKLLAEHGTAEECVEAKETFTNKRIKNAFENHLDDLILSKKLVEIVTDLDIGMTPEQAEYQFSPKAELIEFFQRFGFKSMINKIKEMSFGEHMAQENDAQIPQTDNIGTKFVHKIVDDKNFGEIKKEIERHQEIAIYTEYSDPGVLGGNIISLSISLDGETSYYFPMAHTGPNGSENLSQDIIATLFEITWGDKSKEIISADLKKDLRYFLSTQSKINCKSFDLGQAHFVLGPSGKHDLTYLAQGYLDLVLMEFEKETPPLKEIDFKTAADYCGQRANCQFLLAKKFQTDLKKLDLERVYYEIDHPMISVLGRIEAEGLLLNVPFLKKLEIEFDKQVECIENEIASTENIPVGSVNLKSPKQVGELLFDQMGLPVIKKNKTGYSTDSGVLEELDLRCSSKIPGLILKFREFEKLLSTYVRVLPELINKKTGRLHTHFGLNTAATGRLTSDHPNLQNIPVRTENGREIRKAFMARPGQLLLSADYSQVELRILAHLSNDPIMIEAFLNDEDIHVQTAAQIMGIEPGKVTNEQRSQAKAVNFGLMYGQSSFGLAKAQRISRKDAKEYIEKYFERFSKVREYIDSLIELCKKNGFTQTLFGRKRFLPDINSANANIRQAAQRMATNTPIQGTASDIIKIAMIKIDQEIKNRKLQSKMLLQVHDELIFEVPEEELKIMQELVRQEMEGAVDFKVPLKVDMGYGVNWFNLKG